MGTSNIELTQFASRLGWTLVHSLWQGAGVAMLLVPVLALLRRGSPQARYVASLLALALILVASGVTFRLMRPVTPKEFTSRASSSVSSGSVTEALPRAGDGATAPASARLLRPQAMLERATAGVEPMLPWISIAWAAGVLAMGVCHLGGWVAAQRLRVIGASPPSESIVQITRDVSTRLGLGGPVQVIVSVVALTPMVIGCLRPVVLLPATVVTGLTFGQIEAILAHELAHIRRHDYLINLFQVAAETLLFYHPAVWWISRQVRLEREQCCDEIAVRACGDRFVYAESLAAVEEARRGATLALAARGSGRGQLLTRIRRILGSDCEAPPRQPPVIGATAVVLTAILVSIALINGAARGDSSKTRASTEPAAPASGQTAPATRQAAAFTADCTLSALLDGQRKVLASPAFNVESGSTVRFAYTGKPPVIIDAPAAESGVGVQFRADARPGGTVRIFCRLQPRAEPGGLYKDQENVLLSVHVQHRMAIEQRLNDAKQMLDEAQRDLDRRRIGLSGFQPYTLAEICRVDPTLLAKVNARNEQQTTYDYLVTKYGANYP